MPYSWCRFVVSHFIAHTFVLAGLLCYSGSFFLYGSLTMREKAMPAEPMKFAELFNNPLVEEMHKLTPRDFERFIAYVLRRAGYDAKEVGPHWLRGVDLEILRPGVSTILGGVECKRFQAGVLVQQVSWYNLK
jgi:hypothetical protein